MTSLEACPQRAATPFDTFPPLGCSYLTCKVFSSLPGSHAIISAAKPASFLSKGLPRNMKSWETLVAARWHTRRPGVACPAGSDPWLVPPCIAPFSRSLGRCVSATSPFLSATGASGDHPMIKQRSQRARAVIFVDRVPRAGKCSKGFGSLPLPPPLLYTPPPPFMLMRGSLWGNGHLWLHRPLKQNRAAGISPSSRRGSDVWSGLGSVGPKNTTALSSRFGWVVCLA